MAKKLLSKQTPRIKKEHILWVVIILLATLLASTTWYIVKTSNASKTVSSSTSKPRTQAEEERAQDMVNEIEERRYRYPVIDVKESRVYIPEARLYVPLSEDSRDLRYEMWGETIWFSVSIAVGRQTGNADASCDKVVIFTPTPDRAQGYTLAGTITAKDGSTRYIFKHPTCRLYSDEFSQRLVDVIKQAHYY
jgi:hypothetical protein